jgi:hypothetical protein
MTDAPEYVAQLRDCFADQPEPERQNLLDDVAEHLAEVAAELRAAAGLPAPGTAAAGRASAFGRWKRRLSESAVAAVARRVDRQVGAVFGYAPGSASSSARWHPAGGCCAGTCRPSHSS